MKKTHTTPNIINQNNYIKNQGNFIKIPPIQGSTNENNNFLQEDKTSTNYHSTDDGKSDDKGGSNGLNVSISRTHESFFPKIKRNLEVDEETKLKNFSKPRSGSNSVVNIMSSNVKIEDVISLSYIPNTKLKKVLHVPNFDIFLITVSFDIIELFQELPMSNRKSITTFKESLIHWRRKMGNSNRFIKIYNEYLNQPEG